MRKVVGPNGVSRRKVGHGSDSGVQTHGDSSHVDSAFSETTDDADSPPR